MRGVPVPGCVSTIPAPPRKHSVPDDVSQGDQAATRHPQAGVRGLRVGLGHVKPVLLAVRHELDLNRTSSAVVPRDAEARTAQRACKVRAHRRGVRGLVWLARHVGRLQAGIQGLLGTCLRSKGAAARLRSKAT